MSKAMRFIRSLTSSARSCADENVPGHTTSATPLLDSMNGKGTTAPSFLNDNVVQRIQARNSTQPHRLHVLSSKHNTHITFVQPPQPTLLSGGSGSGKKDVLLSLSAGNIGFKKSGRGSYDAAYQLAAHVMKQIHERGLARDMHRLEVVFRGFGQGREAVTKVLLGDEGRRIRGAISAVIDATRIKLGGPRGKRPRRLG
ncbi:translational machinery component [Piedraia hortae CBS 480.64]|uniref:Translational machinery component n=1 Tax=Piedraia hortae CBS 480.64 TaxID=1314780 RepID=A0A6A7BXA6_9PEZI|nr:translational machinery component [Piedraia hortae CBS 480.64]